MGSMHFSGTIYIKQLITRRHRPTTGVIRALWVLSQCVKSNTKAISIPDGYLGNSICFSCSAFTDTLDLLEMIGHVAV